MPSEFPRSPQLLKGALAVYDSDAAGTQPVVIVFQYNPAELSRDLSLRAPPRDPGNVGNAREDVRRVLGPPLETISLSVELDAADQLEDPDGNKLVAENGLHPALAALEMLLYPPGVRVQEIEQQAAGGEVQLSPTDVPLVLLVLGKSRVAPVFLTKFSITEQAFDRSLNPIRAKVDLGMRVLTYMELDRDTLGFDAYLAFQNQKESLAADHHNSANTPSGVTNLLPSS